MDALLDAFACDFRASLPRVEVPALLLYGACSSSTTQGVREFMEQTIPQSRLVVFEQSGHVPMLEETEKFNRALDEFAKEVA
jgi:pimeloyl-ACP methyl ester carboxylesterase